MANIIKLFFILFLFLNNISVKAAETTFNFLTLADIHFDPFITCNQNISAPCPLIVELRHVPVKQWDDIFAKYEKQYFPSHQDSNHFLTNAAFAIAKQITQEKKPLFILVLGDLLGHDFPKRYRKYSADTSRQGYQQFVKKVFNYLTERLQQSFAAQDVFLIVGNNDSYHNDYMVYTHSHFFNDLAQFSKSLMQQSISATSRFKEAGYYAYEMSSIKILVLNSVLFSNKARGPNLPLAAERQLKWLNQELISAKEKQQKVLLAMHIPPAIDIYIGGHIYLFTLKNLWKTAYIKEFDQQIQKYANQIIGIFVGHLHQDWSQFLTLDKSQVPLFGTPAISPIFGNAPSMKLYSYRLPSFTLHKAIVYELSTNKISQCSITPDKCIK